MASTKSKIKSKVSSAAKSVSSAVKSAVSSVGKASQSASVYSSLKSQTPVTAKQLATTPQKAPQYTPVTGTGTKANGYTYTPTGWQPSSTAVLSSPAPKQSIGKASVAPNQSIGSATRGLSSISKSSGGSTLQTPNMSVPNMSVGTSTFSSLSGSPSGTNSINNVSSPYSSTVNIPNALRATDLKPTSDLYLPEKKVTEVPMIAPVVSPIEDTATKATQEKDTALQDYLKTIAGEAPSSADAYTKAQQETEILKKQQIVGDLTGKLNAIVSQGEANKLALIGQGRGIPEAIIGGQQAQIARETAIQALPIQAQLEAAQGNLEMANENLDTLFKIYSEDARNEYEYKREVKKAIYDYASDKEKRALEKLDKQEERAYQEQQDLYDEQNSYAKMAFQTGQSSLGAKIAKLDYKSPTFKQELANLSSQIVDSKRNLEIQKLQNDLVNIGTTINPKVLNTTQFKAAQAAQNLKLTLEKAKAAVQKYGNREIFSGAGAGELNTLKVQLRSEISTALEQGVVVPGEAAAFDQIAGQLNKSFFIRNSKTLSAIDSLSKSMDGRVALQKAALTNTYNVTPEQVDTLLNITDLSDQEFADMDAIIE